MTLRGKLLLPLALASVVAAAAGAFIAHRAAREALASLLPERAHWIGESITAAALNCTEAELQGVVATLARAAGVEQIAVVGGKPPRVLASSDHAQLGRAQAELPDAAAAAAIADVLATERPRMERARGTRLEHVAPLRARSDTAAEPQLGAVLVRLDDAAVGTPGEAAASRLALVLGATVAALVLAAAFALAFVMRRPTTLLLRTLARRSSGDRTARAAVAGAGELGDVARALNELLDGIDREEALRRAAEQSLRASESEARAALDELELHKIAMDQHALVSEADRGGRITYANEHFCNVSGYSREELLGRDHSILNSGTHPRAFFAHMFGRLASVGVWRGDICNRRKSGELYWVDSTIVAQRDASGRITRYISFRADITARKRSEQANRELLEQQRGERDRAQAGERAKSEFLATMSHELRTPLNGVIGFANLLGDTRLDDEQREFVSILRNSANALLGIINDILDFSKIDAGKLTLEAAPFDLADVAEQVAELFSEQCAGKGIDLLFDVAADTPTRLIGDQGRLRQVLLNLVGNAVKFTSAGYVAIRIRLCEGAPVPRVEVMDTGIGIPAEKQTVLFQRFQQVDASTTRQFGGTGLGLAISRKLVEAMGGAIGIDSAPGHGSTFWFTVGLPAQEAAPAAKPPARGRSGRVLLVTGRSAIAELLAARLAELGLAARVAPDVDAACAALAGERRPNSPLMAILVDRRVPGAESRETIGRLRSAAAEAGARLLSIARFRERGDGIAALYDAVLAEPLVRRAALHAVLFGTSGDAPPAAPESAAEPLHRRVLVAEDNPVNQKLARTMLAALGCEVDVAATGSEAVARTREIDYDLVLMDCQMPDLDGYQATHQIRAAEAPGRHLPIVAFTASALPEERERCAQAGMDGFVTKPVRKEDLRNVLTRFAKRRAEALARRER